MASSYEYARPLSSDSIISPHAALEALAAHDGLDIHDSFGIDSTGGSDDDFAFGSGGGLRGLNHSQGQHNQDNARGQGRGIGDHDQLHPPQGYNAYASSSRSTPRQQPRRSIAPSSTGLSSNGNGNGNGGSSHSQDSGSRSSRGSFSSEGGGHHHRLFVRARFDFEATDPSALSFAAGEIIEVITRLDSGWWDGILVNKLRGWFPSNFVEEIETNEALRILSGQPSTPQPKHVKQDSRGGDTQVQGHRQIGSLSSIASLQMDDAARQAEQEVPEDDFTWGDMLNKAGGGSSMLDYDVGLDDLAREVMRGASTDDEDDAEVQAREFQIAAAQARRRNHSDAQSLKEIAWLGQHDPRRNHTEQFGLASRPGGAGGLDEFGVPANRRAREETGETVRGLKPSALTLTQRQAQHEEEIREEPTVTSRRPSADPDSAWVPSITPDGQVYYHNTQTGEDSWDLPPDTPGNDSAGTYSGDEDDFFGTFRRGESSTAYGNPSGFSSASHDRPPSPGQPSFRPPAKLQKDLPYPWIARMSDDGSEWFYLNRQTGETRRNPPSSRPVSDQMETLSIASSSLAVPAPTVPSRAPVRQSWELRKKHVDEWSKLTTDAMQGLLTPPISLNLGWHMDMVNDALREVFEAAVTGSAADEELSRAEALGSDVGIEDALLREESAVEMLQVSHGSLLEILRSLLACFGYVGPLDGMNDMPRPAWTGDMTLIGSIGLLSSNVHAAVYSKKVGQSGLSTWAEVMRAASKLKDVISGFPSWIGEGLPRGEQEAILGKRLICHLTVDGVGEILGGKWGFGQSSLAQLDLSPLNLAAVADLQRLKGLIEEVQQNDDSILDIIRTVTKFTTRASNIDIAIAVDVDGDISQRAREDQGKIYSDTVTKVHSALHDLEKAHLALHSGMIALATADKFDGAVYTTISNATGKTLESIIALLQLSSTQRSLADKHGLRAQIGVRSPRYIPTRPPSVASKISRKSLVRSIRTRGLDEEDEDLAAMASERRDTAGEMAPTSAGGISASASQTSLSRRDPMSATSSTTSLAYQQTDSDGGSIRGKRSSIMNFMKGRSSEETNRGTRGRGVSKKLAKLLGEDPQWIHSVPPPQSAGMMTPQHVIPESPWFLGEDYSAEDIVFDDKGGVRAGTLRGLIARLTPHGQTDTSFFQCFLLTFRSFTNPPELFELLVERYNIEEPEGLNAGEALDWRKLKQTPIRLRVANTIRSWLDTHYISEEDEGILDRVEDFARTTLLTNGSELLSKQLLNLVDRRRSGEGDTQRRIISGGLLSPPAPLVPRVLPGKQLKLTDIAPLELARQLTILEFGYFQRIKPVECLNKAWNRPDGDTVAPNVRSVIKTANTLSGWVCTMCLSSKDPKQRAAIMKYFIQTAMELRNLNNFSSMAAVAAGLNIAPVLRLKRTKELLSQKTNAVKAELDKTLDSTKNFSNYKDMLKTINPPCVPFFGFWLSALTFIEDGNKDMVMPGSAFRGMTNSASSNSLASTTNGMTPMTSVSNSSTTPIDPQNTPLSGPQKPLINFFKRSLSAEILRDIQQYQSQPYNLAKCKVVHDWMIKQLEVCDKSYDLNKLYELSLQLEPREREEERITRMLHDSGFI